MPLDGFDLVSWASNLFGGVPPLLLGAAALVLLIAGVVCVVGGFRVAPVSWALMAAGGGVLVLTYFIAGAAIAGMGSTLEGGAQVASSAPRVVPGAAAVALIGLALFGLRVALRAWSTGEGGGRGAAVLLALGAMGGIFLGVQVVRGAQAGAHTSGGSGAAEAGSTSGEADSTDAVERPRGITAGGRRH